MECKKLMPGTIKRSGRFFHLHESLHEFSCMNLFLPGVLWLLVVCYNGFVMQTGNNTIQEYNIPIYCGCRKFYNKEREIPVAKCFMIFNVINGKERCFS